MTEINLTKDQYDAAARELLDSLGTDDSLTSRHIPTPGPVAPGIAPLVVPDGYTLRETHRTHTDGSTELIREFVRDPAPQAGPHPVPTAFTERRTLPDWLADNARKVKAATYLAGAAAVTTAGAVYGDAIAAGITAGAGALWSATLTVLKVIGVAAGIGVLLRLTFGGRRRRPRTGTFEGVVRGTWRQD
ncbi:hypothetical protein [Streptomyces sp. NPDC087297]|uniref:hypothetical protein n=1 Tax=Streptomyces sp. NPDC087297 TaxID=3365778 RepID=UPI003818B8AC